MRRVCVLLLIGCFWYAYPQRRICASDWKGHFPTDSVERYLVSVEDAPDTPADWLGKRCRQFAVESDVAEHVIEGLLHESAESIEWAGRVVSRTREYGPEYVFALAILARHDASRLQTEFPRASQAEGPGHYVSELCQRPRRPPSLVEMQFWPGLLGMLSHDLVLFLEDGTLTWAPEREWPQGFREMFHRAMQEELPPSELADLRELLAVADATDDRDMEIFARVALFHQAGEMAVIEEALEREGEVFRGMLNALGQLYGNTSARDLLLRTAQMWESRAAESRIPVHSLLIDALSWHDDPEVTKYLGYLLEEPTQYSRPPARRCILYALCSRENSKEARQLADRYVSSQARLVFEALEWLDLWRADFRRAEP